jgi:hypothetical protein
MTDIGEHVPLRPGRALVQGVPHMFDFMGVLSQKRPARSVEEDMTLAWRDVLGVVKAPPPAGPFPLRGQDSAAASVLGSVSR